MHNDKLITNQIIMLLETILGQNYFTFQDQIYQPDKGVAMGSPISGTVAEIFLQLEKPTSNTVLTQNIRFSMPDTWTIYMLSVIPHLLPPQIYNITWTQSTATLNSTQHLKPTTRSTSWTFNQQKAHLPGARKIPQTYCDRHHNQLPFQPFSRAKARSL